MKHIRKCDSDKHRKLVAKQHENRNENHRFQTAKDAEWERQKREREAKRKEEELRERRRMLADPRRPHLQQIVNILDGHLRRHQDDMFIQEVFQMMGVKNVADYHKAVLKMMTEPSPRFPDRIETDDETPGMIVIEDESLEYLSAFRGSCLEGKVMCVDEIARYNPLSRKVLGLGRTNDANP